MRIRDVVKETGVPRELIHHYLRQNLLPKPEKRARYSEQHVKLLQLLKILREDHQLPLEVIRQIFDLFDFDPARLTPIALSDSLKNRIDQMLNGRTMLPPTIGEEAILHQTGITSERLRDYISAKLVQPIVQEGQEKFCTHDISIIILGEIGAAVGIPFESIRTVGAYVRVGFDLEHHTIFNTARKASLDERGFVGEVFMRKELVVNFILHLLQSLLYHRMMDFIILGEEVRTTFNDIVYSPSPMFLKRHQLEAAIDAAQDQLALFPEDSQKWQNTIRLMLHAGRYHEGHFAAEQAIQKFPRNALLRMLHTKAQVLSGQFEMDPKRAGQVFTKSKKDALTILYRTISLLARTDLSQSVERMDLNAASVVELIETAIAAAEHETPESKVEVDILAGWALTILPPAYQNIPKGISLMVRAYQSLLEGMLKNSIIPGLWERYLINSAYLLFISVGKASALNMQSDSNFSIPDSEALRSLILNLDPGSEFAENVFLNPS